MSYISLINDFWKTREKETIPSHTADLYLYLLHRCNKGNWMNPFNLSTKEIERDLEMTRPTICKARVLLTSLGLVEFQEGKTRGNHSIYTIKNAPKKSECVKEIYTIEGECVNECVKECVNECVKEIYTIVEKKESFSPHPFNKEKKEIYKEKKDSKTIRTRTHEEPKGISELREIFLDEWAREKLMKEFMLHDAEVYLGMVEEILAEWAITYGENLVVDQDRKNHFVNKLRIKNRERNANNVKNQQAQRRTTNVSTSGADEYGGSF